MNIELKQAAQQALNALDEATTYTGSPSWSPSMTDECIAAASALRAILALRPERVPMTDEQINEMALQEEFLLVCDGFEELTEIVRAVEAHHGITAQDAT